MIKSIPWWSPQTTANDYKFVKKVLQSNYLNEGEVTEEFERKLARLLNVKYSLATTSGTIAIFLALKALKVGVGDEIIIPDITFIATCNAVMLTGARPVLVDVDPETLNINPQAIEKAITKKTRVIIPVHVSGRACQMKEILDIAKRNNLRIVEDAAEAILSKYNGKYLGTLGDLGCFSFSPNKTISTGQGGLVVTNNKELFLELIKLKDHGRSKRGTGGDDIHESVGFNFKFTNLQAAVGLGQLTKLLDRIKVQKQINRIYKENLQDLTDVKLFYFSPDEVPQWTDVIVDNRSGLDKYLSSRNINCRRYWFPIHRQMPYKEPDLNFPISSKLSFQALWLPSAFTLKTRDILTVCNKIRNFYR
jgi:perosamine synthetase